MYLSGRELGQNAQDAGWVQSPVAEKKYFHLGVSGTQTQNAGLVWYGQDLTPFFFSLCGAEKQSLTFLALVWELAKSTSLSDIVVATRVVSNVIEFSPKHKNHNNNNNVFDSLNELSPMLLDIWISGPQLVALFGGAEEVCPWWKKLVSGASPSEAHTISSRSLHLVRVL